MSIRDISPMMLAMNRFSANAHHLLISTKSTEMIIHGMVLKRRTVQMPDDFESQITCEEFYGFEDPLFDESGITAAGYDLLADRDEARELI